MGHKLEKKMKKIPKLRDICYVSTNYSDDNYVGIKFLEDEIKIFFPIGYEIPDDNSECRKSIINLIKTISIGNKLKKNDSKYSNNNGEENEIPFNSFLWIINDYLNNGLYTDKEKIYKRGQNGKINWKKTLSSQFYVSGKNAIYLNPYVEKNTLEDNVITDIHAYCVGVSINYIGWIFGNIPIPINNIIEKRIDYYLTILNKEIIHSFDDHKKNLLINLKKILEMSGGNNKSSLKNYGTNQYEYIWEYMVNEVYGNEQVDLYFPNSKYHLIGFNNPIDASSLRPDTMLSIEKDVYILDSKYYKYGVTKNPMHLPSTDSVQKQITYGEHIKNNFNQFENIYNAFIIPYNKVNNPFELANNIEYVGFAESSWKKSLSNNYFEKVSVILLDTKYLIDCYNKYVDNSLEKMVSSIQKIMSEFNES